MLNCARAITPAPRAFRRSAAATTAASCAAPLPALSASIASATNSVCNVEVDGNSGGIDTSVGANDAMSPMGWPDSVVAFTASVTPMDRSRITDAGFDGFIGKPINLKEFLETVRKTVEGKAP